MFKKDWGVELCCVRDVVHRARMRGCEDSQRRDGKEKKKRKDRERERVF